MPKGVYTHKKGRPCTWGDKLSKALTGKVVSEEARINMSKAHQGKKITEEQKEKTRNSMLGKNKGKCWTQEQLGKAKIRMTGRKLTQETKDKIKESNKGFTHTQESKDKIRKANLGKIRLEMRGENNPMHTHKNSYKSKFGKVGFRQDIGLFVRSSWEANIYRIYKYLGHTLFYELRSFILSDGRTYRPDFYVADLQLWLEVKGRWLKDAKERFDLFVQEYPDEKIEIIGPVQYKNLISVYGDKINKEG